MHNRAVGHDLPPARRERGTLPNVVSDPASQEMTVQSGLLGNAQAPSYRLRSLAA